MVTGQGVRRFTLGFALVGFALVVGALGCGSPGDEAAYPKADGNPPPRTSDGQVLGADGKSLERALAEEPTNLHPAPRPDADAGAGDAPRQ